MCVYTGTASPESFWLLSAESRHLVHSIVDRSILHSGGNHTVCTSSAQWTIELYRLLSGNELFQVYRCILLHCRRLLRCSGTYAAQ